MCVHLTHPPRPSLDPTEPAHLTVRHTTISLDDTTTQFRHNNNNNNIKTAKMASPGPHLFTIPIPPIAAQPGGAVVCTEPAPAVYLLTMTSPPDNRLTPASCGALLDALDLIEFGGYKPGVVMTTSGIQKFYSNGLDLELALATEGFIVDGLFRLFRRFLT